MTSPRSRSSTVPVDDELRLPRPPGVIRQFWARHPRLTDGLIALLCLVVTLGASSAFTRFGATPAPATAVTLTLLTVAGCALVFWRRRFPVALAALAIAFDLLLVLSKVTSGSPLFLIAVYTLAVHRSTRACWIGLAAGVTAVSSAAFGQLLLGAGTVHEALNLSLGEAIPGLVAALIGINIGNRRRYVEAIIDRSRQLLVERDQQAQLAAAAERERIAREMHDIVSHSLTVVVALSEGAAATADADRAREASMAASATARSALSEMRSMLGVLRDDSAGDAPLAPLVAADPAATVQAAQQAGFGASLAVRGEPVATPALRLAIGRIVQEGVTNAMRHAPMSSAITVRIDYDADPIVIEVVNDGVTGRASTSGGFGLRGLAERAALLGGVLASAPAGAGRWMLRAELPHTTEEGT